MQILSLAVSIVMKFDCTLLVDLGLNILIGVRKEEEEVAVPSSTMRMTSGDSGIVGGGRQAQYAVNAADNEDDDEDDEGESSDQHYWHSLFSNISLIACDAHTLGTWLTMYSMLPQTILGRLLMPAATVAATAAVPSFASSLLFPCLTLVLRIYCNAKVARVLSVFTSSSSSSNDDDDFMLGGGGRRGRGRQTYRQAELAAFSGEGRMHARYLLIETSE
jgi:hypothetical protein